MIKGKVNKNAWIQIEARRLAKKDKQAFLSVNIEKYTALAKVNYKEPIKERPISTDEQVEKKPSRKKRTKDVQEG